MTKAKVRVFAAVAAADLELQINDWIAQERPNLMARTELSVAAGSSPSSADVLYALVVYEPSSASTAVTVPGS